MATATETATTALAMQMALARATAQRLSPAREGHIGAFADLYVVRAVRMPYILLVFGDSDGVGPEARMTRDPRDPANPGSSQQAQRHLKCLKPFCLKPHPSKPPVKQWRSLARPATGAWSRARHASAYHCYQGRAAVGKSARRGMSH
jgi:hypothetical protein